MAGGMFRCRPSCPPPPVFNKGTPRSFAPRRAKELLLKALTEIRAAVPGERNNALLVNTMRAAGLVAAGAFPPEAVFAELIRAGLAIGMTRMEVERLWKTPLVRVGFKG